MRQHIKKQHFTLAKWISISSVVVVVIFVLWKDSIINLPPRMVFFLRSFSASLFSTPVTPSQLNIIFHRQEHSLSCEAASVKMVLDYYGMNLSESEIIKNMPFDKTARVNGVWGDPDAGFVGDIDGKMGIDGYGIHWNAVATFVSKWKKTEVIQNGLAGDLTRHISAGRPVIVWGYFGRGRPMTWLTPEGKKIYAINGEHVRVVYGYKGSAENPDGFMVMDPVYGPAYWEKSQFLRNWDSFGRVGVVIFDK